MGRKPLGHPANPQARNWLGFDPDHHRALRLSPRTSSCQRYDSTKGRNLWPGVGLVSSGSAGPRPQVARDLRQRRSIRDNFRERSKRYRWRLLRHKRPPRSSLPFMLQSPIKKTAPSKTDARFSWAIPGSPDSTRVTAQVAGQVGAALSLCGRGLPRALLEAAGSPASLGTRLAATPHAIQADCALRTGGRADAS